MDLAELYQNLVGEVKVTLTGVSDAAKALLSVLSHNPSDRGLAISRLGNMLSSSSVDSLRLVLPPEVFTAANEDHTEHRRRASAASGPSVTLMFKDFRTCPIYTPPSLASDEDDFL